MITDIAESQITDSIEYYRNRAGIKIAHNLFLEIFESIERIRESPFFPIKIKSYRSYPLPKFPYILFYEVIEQSMTIKILALFHTAQNPDKYPS
ncbi:MAG: type II toxin-antitoxin system RelE/ParE family toxin [Bacteroidetes bacterium]|nr:type II toxin-antitoxin system RelE/ParE family toxin [Bacteroidota bacterium]